MPENRLHVEIWRAFTDRRPRSQCRVQPNLKMMAMNQIDLDKFRDITDHCCAIFQRDQDGAVQDIHGDWWMTGVFDGQLVKRRFDFRNYPVSENV